MSSSSLRGEPSTQQEISRAAAAARRYIRLRVRSARDVRSYLQRRRFTPAIINSTLCVLSEQGLLDDRASAILWSAHWARRGYSDAAICLKLSAKGFEESCVKDSVKRLRSCGDDEVTRARRVIEEKTTLSSRRFKRAQIALLLSSRGFDAEVIRQALSDTLGSEFPYE